MVKVWVDVDKDYYESIEKRIMREHKVVIHARTRELITTATNDTQPKVYHKKHLGAFPTVAYHRFVNAVHIALSKVEKHERTTPTDYAKLNFKYTLIKRKRTSQYKTVWKTKYTRRR